MHRNTDTLNIYQTALRRINRCFKEYYDHPNGPVQGKTLHFTSQQMRNFPNLINFFQNGPGHSLRFQTDPDQFERMCENMRILNDLKVTCVGEYTVELQLFTSLQNLHIIGPCLGDIKGLRCASSNLVSLIVENGNISLRELLSQCCMDESRPIVWPQLLSLKISNCALRILDASLKLLPNLQELDVSFNELSDVKDELSCLEQITHLNMGFNRIKSIPEFAGDIRWRLQFIYLPYNDLSDLEGLQVLENVIELDVGHNLLVLHDILEPLRHLARLEKLNLRGNPMCCRSKHRELAVRFISSLAITSSFCLDGKQLTNHDLAEAMYTPVAVQYNNSRQFDTSINSVEQDSYDVSLSPSKFSQRYPRKESFFRSSASNFKVDSEDLARRDSSNSRNKFSTDIADRSSVQDQAPLCIESPSTPSIETLGSSSSSSSSVHGEPPPLVKVTDIVNEDKKQNPFPRTLSVTEDLVDNAMITIVAQKCNEGELGNNVELILMKDELLETDFDSGAILATFEFSAIISITVLSPRKINLKFSYRKKQLNSRVYEFPNEKMQKLSWFFEQLKSICKNNAVSNMHHLVCLKCSSQLVSADSSTVCTCGSNMAVVNREEPSNLIATLSECEEAADTEGDDVVKLLDEDPENRDISLSWMHDAPAQASHASGSLPTYFREVLGVHTNQSTATNLQASALPGEDADNPDMQFKSFPNLLPAHEIYKLVQVTPGVAAGAVGEVSTEKQTVKSPLKARPFTPQLSGSISDRDMDRELDHHRKQVTSTPRRKTRGPKVGIRPDALPRLPPPPDFEKRPGAGTSVDEDLWSHRTKWGDLQHDQEWLRAFIEDELLSSGELLMCMRRCMVLGRTGGQLAESAGQRTPSKGLFTRRNDSMLKQSCGPASSYVNCLLIVTSAYLHIIDISDSNTIGPEQLQSFALESIVGVTSGLRSLTTVIAAGVFDEKKPVLPGFLLVFAVPFSAADKCLQFQKRLLASVAQCKVINANTLPRRVPVKNVFKEDYALPARPADARRPFSDFLEKNFSENVLLHLDLSAPDVQYSGSADFERLLNEDMFCHFPCSLLDDGQGAEMPALFVISCSGSLSVVHENFELAMRAYAMALLLSVKEKGREKVLEDENSLIISKLSAVHASNQMFGIKFTKPSAVLTGFVRFANQSDYLQLCFKDDEVGWSLKLSDANAVEHALSLIAEFVELEGRPSLNMSWR